MNIINNPEQVKRKEKKRKEVFSTQDVSSKNFPIVIPNPNIKQQPQKFLSRDYHFSYISVRYSYELL